MKIQTKKTAAIGMFCALAYAAAAAGRIPIVLFLKYDPKDIIIAVSGFLYGPLTAFTVALAASFAEMITVSETGILGFMMNVISSSCFACTAALIYKRKHTLYGAAAGLLCGWGCMVSGMLLWNCLVAPIYMGYPREAVVKLLLPVFLPFNLIKGGLNAAITMYLYKPVATALRRSHLIESKPGSSQYQRHPGILLISLLVLAACVWLIVALKRASWT